MRRVSFFGRSAISFVSFNLGWWACALGSKHGYPWLGPALLPIWVALHLRLSPTPKGEGVFLVALTALGFLIDTALIKLELFTVNPVSMLAPLWLVSMWTLLGLTFEGMLVWRQKLN
jgi:hypothetical protein